MRAVAQRAPDESSPVAEPLWFGPRERPLLGWLHLPADRRARGGVVLCPPFGVEHNFAVYVYRELADRLARSGFAALRFDYDGTGQSAGDLNDRDRVGAYRRSVVAAVALLRDAGADWVAGVGLRLGATILADAVEHGCAVDSMVLWDPCLSGRTFLREQITLWSAPAGRDRRDQGPGTEIAGYLLSSETDTALRALKLPAELGSRPDGTLVLLDPQRSVGRKLRRHLSAAAGIEWDEYREPETILDVLRHRAPLPTAVLAQIVDWLDGRCGRDSAAVALPEAVSRRAVIAHRGDGTPIIEEVLRLGPARLFGVCAHLPAGATRSVQRRRPVLVFLNMGLSASTGPGREWVSLSRQWAAAGYRAVRFDLSGIGESPARPGWPARALYAAWTTDDIRDATAAASPEDPSNVVLIGVCAGAVAALRAAAQLRPRGVVAINPPFRFMAAGYPVPRLTPRPAVARGHRARRPRRLISRLAGRIPPGAWPVLTRLGLARSPESEFASVVALGVPTLVLCDTVEARWARDRAPRLGERLQRARPGGLVSVPSLGHSLRDERSRVVVREALDAFLADLAETTSATAAPGSERVSSAVVRDLRPTPLGV